MIVDGKVTGADDIAWALKELHGNVQAPVGAAARKALKPLLKATKAALKANGNIVTGDLYRALTVKKRARTPKNVTVYQMGPSKANPDYRLGHLIEFGTAPHMEKTGSGQAWMHPGSRAFPFMRPAFQSTKDEVIRLFGENFGIEVEAQARKVAARRGLK